MLLNWWLKDRKERKNIPEELRGKEYLKKKAEAEQKFTEELAELKKQAEAAREVVALKKEEINLTPPSLPLKPCIICEKMSTGDVCSPECLDEWNKQNPAPADVSSD